jgi:hypothetical protein
MPAFSCAGDRARYLNYICNLIASPMSRHAPHGREVPMIRRARNWPTGLLGLLLAGCASQQVATPEHHGESSYRALSNQHMAHYQLELGATYSGATPLQHPAPVYPPALLASCPPPVTMRALLVVGTDGKVDDVRVTPVPGAAPAFAAAVRDAALQWRFEPLQIGHWAADARGDSHPVDVVTKPFSLPYEFRFACRDGKPQTGSSADLPVP